MDGGEAEHLQAHGRVLFRRALFITAACDGNRISGKIAVGNSIEFANATKMPRACRVEFSR
jgi:hypothetical protein